MRGFGCLSCLMLTLLACSKDRVYDNPVDADSPAYYTGRPSVDSDGDGVGSYKDPDEPSNRPRVYAGQDTVVLLGEAAHFRGSAIDPGNTQPPGSAGQIVKYAWDYGDGSTWISATAGETSHTYLAPGTYVAVFMALDGEGNNGSQAIQVTVRAPFHELLLVPAGEFPMGSTSGASDEQPVHTVYLNGYYIDKYEVTNAQWNVCARYTGMGVKSEPDNHPVLHAAWYDAQAYCRWAALRLPTEAEWEKAARGTDERTYPWGEGLDRRKANYGAESCCTGDASDGYLLTAPVGSFPAGISPYGVHDMAGNVWEWVVDWDGGYPSSRVNNPTGPTSGAERVVRGGSWGSLPSSLRAAARSRVSPSGDFSDVGFRCARDQ